MTLTKQSLEELKKTALGTTPGPLYASERPDGSKRFVVFPSGGEPVAYGLRQEDANFFITASPDVILDLIARVEGLSEALEFYSEKSLYQNRRSHPENCSTDLEWDSGYRAKSALENFGVK